MTNVDTVIHSRWIIPVNPQRAVLEHHALVIQGQQIVDCLPSHQAREQYQAQNEIDLPGHALIPGLINTHGHAAMSLFRGLADDLPLMTWLQEHIWPAEGQWVSESFVEDGVKLAIAEMLRSGTTTFSDQYFFPEVSARVAKTAGVRAQLNFPILDFPNPWSQNADEAIEKGLALYLQYQNDDQVFVIFGPHAPYTVSDDPLKKIAQMAKEQNIGIQMHVHETQQEVDDSLQQHGKRPLRRLYDLGLLGPHMQCTHMTALNEEDFDLLEKTGTHINHCPESNLKLASGFCPVDALQKRGINVALGTDGAASNNDLDLLGEMRTAAMLAKAVSGNAEALPAYEALAMATINGAQAIGQQDRIGSLEIGKQADITAIDLSELESQPVYDPVSHLAYTTTRHQVTDVWVAGQPLLSNRQLTTLSEADLIQSARDWQEQITQARKDV